MGNNWTDLPHWLPLGPEQRLPAIILDADTGAVLMLVELNREAVELVAATGRLHYYHPEKRKVVAKGEASGHFQNLSEVRLNCRGDQLLLKVRPMGGACELGYHSCFFRRLTPDGWQAADPKTFNPEEIYPEIAFSH